MRRPYLQEPHLQKRVSKYVDDNEDIDADDLTEYLVKTYKGYSRKNKTAFNFSVRKALEWEVHQRRIIDCDDDDDILDSDGGGPDIIELESPTKVTNDISTTMNNLYKQKISTTPASSPRQTDASPYRMRTETPKDEDLGQINGFDTTPGKPAKKRRKKEDEVHSTIKRKKKIVGERLDPTVTLADMAGIQSLWEVILNLQGNLLYPPGKQAPGAYKPWFCKSALITGPTGSGKTMLVHALAGESKVGVLEVSASDFSSGMVGDDNAIKDVFDEAMSLAPCILLIQDMDTIATKDGTSNRGIERRISARLSQYLNDLKIKNADKEVLVFMETSKPEALDWKLRRSMSEEIFMPVPNEAARLSILQLLCKDINCAAVNLNSLAHKTPSYVAGDLQRLVEVATKTNKRRRFDRLLKELPNELNDGMKYSLLFNKLFTDDLKQEEDINMEDFTEAITQVTPALKKEGFPTIPDVTWQDVGGLEDIKQELQEKILDPIEHKDIHKIFNANRPNGILMWGPPGCGKTLLAQAIANEAGFNLLPVSGPELLNMYQGESERAIRETFRRAQSVAPCVIFFDEFDSICPARTNRSESGSKTTVVTTILAEMNGYTKRNDVYVIAATNRPDMLDQAVTRPGRFDTLLYVGLPNYDGRVSILRALTKNGTHPKLSEDVNFSNIAKKSEHYSGADLSWLVYNAAKKAMKPLISAANLSNTKPIESHESTENSTDGADKNEMNSVVSSLLLDNSNCRISAEHFTQALDCVCPSVKTKQRLHYERLRKKLQQADRSFFGEEIQSGQEKGLPLVTDDNS